MEKFVKFDDPSCGLNPFMPLDNKDAKELSTIANVCRHVGKAFLIFLRVPCILMCLLMIWSCHIWKVLLMIPYLIRLVERFFDYAIMNFML